MLTSPCSITFILASSLTGKCSTTSTVNHAASEDTPNQRRARAYTRHHVHHQRRISSLRHCDTQREAPRGRDGHVVNRHGAIPSHVAQRSPRGLPPQVSRGHGDSAATLKRTPNGTTTTTAFHTLYFIHCTYTFTTLHQQSICIPIDCASSNLTYYILGPATLLLVSAVALRLN